MATSASLPRRAGRRRWLFVLLILAAVLVAAAAAHRRHQATPTRPPAVRAPAPVSVTPRPLPLGPPVPAPTSLRVPSHFEQTEAGAVRAAVAYVTFGPALLDMGPGDAERAMRAMATVETADDQVAHLLSGLDALSGQMPAGHGPLRYFQAPIAARVEAFAPGQSRVAVWHVGVFSSLGGVPPQASWATSVVNLVWQSGDWKIHDEEVSPGPAPVLDRSAPPTSPGEFDDALAGFTAPAGP